jgi:hypothetical protein
MLSYSNILYLVATFWVDMHFVLAEPITCATILRSEVQFISTLSMGTVTYLPCSMNCCFR